MGGAMIDLDTLLTYLLVALAVIYIAYFATKESGLLVKKGAPDSQCGCAKCPQKK